MKAAQGFVQFQRRLCLIEKGGAQKLPQAGEFFLGEDFEESKETGGGEVFLGHSYSFFGGNVRLKFGRIDSPIPLAIGQVRAVIAFIIPQDSQNL